MVKVCQLSLDPCPGLAGGYYLPGSVVSGVLNVEVVSPAPYSYIRVRVAESFELCLSGILVGCWASGASEAGPLLVLPTRVVGHV